MSPDFAREWIKKAKADQMAALRALQDARHGKDQAEIACFHAQQCVEKYMKAILAVSGQPIPRTHDLLSVELIIRKNCNLNMKRLLPCLRRLGQYAVEIRYPGATASVKDAISAISAMGKIIEFFIPRLNKLLET
jgi:HEPN domain-containing protein